MAVAFRRGATTLVGWVDDELGQDYLKAGLLDRAEETFNQLADTPYGTQARRAMLEIYQREKEWVRAIDAAVPPEKRPSTMSL